MLDIIERTIAGNSHHINNKLELRLELK